MCVTVLSSLQSLCWAVTGVESCHELQSVSVAGTGVGFIPRGSEGQTQPPPDSFPKPFSVPFCVPLHEDGSRKLEHSSYLSLVALKPSTQLFPGTVTVPGLHQVPDAAGAEVREQPG